MESPFNNASTKTTQRIILDTPTSKLEAEIYRNTAAPDGSPALLLIHPHSLLGGSMHDFVIAELFRNATSNPNVAAVLRYNCRGVGGSTGSKFSLKNFKGQQDAADVLEMTEFLATQLQDMGGSRRIVIIGYSFGSVLASYALDHPSVSLYTAISFPLGGLSVLVQTKQRFKTVCSASHVQRLMVLGSDDQYTKVDALKKEMELVGGRMLQDDCSFHTIGGADNKKDAVEKAKPFELKVFNLNDHFWGNDAAAMADYVVNYSIAAVSS